VFYARRYFFPLLSNLPMYRHLPSAGEETLPVAKRAAEQVLCLPYYHDLAEADQMRLVEVIRSDPRRAIRPNSSERL
jgi:dTDP-4-amino-4,6-dideoxygalactose transaminase